MPTRPPHLAQTALPQCPCLNGWALLVWMRLGQQAKSTQGRVQNAQQQILQKRRTTDAGPRTTAPSKTRILTTTEQLWLLDRRPYGAPFNSQRLSCQLRYAAHGRFAKARPACLTAIRLRSRPVRRTPSSGSLIAQTKRHTVPWGVCSRGAAQYVH